MSHNIGELTAVFFVRIVVTVGMTVAEELIVYTSTITALVLIFLTAIWDKKWVGKYLFLKDE